MAKIEDDILDGLEGFEYEGSIKHSDDLTKALEVGVRSIDYTQLVSWMSTELYQICGLEEQIHPVESEENINSFMLELSSFLKELGRLHICCCYCFRHTHVCMYVCM